LELLFGIDLLEKKQLPRWIGQYESTLPVKGDIPAGCSLCGLEARRARYRPGGLEVIFALQVAGNMQACAYNFTSWVVAEL